MKSTLIFYLLFWNKLIIEQRESNNQKIASKEGVIRINASDSIHGRTEASEDIKSPTSQGITSEQYNSNNLATNDKTSQLDTHKDSM